MLLALLENLNQIRVPECPQIRSAKPLPEPEPEPAQASKMEVKEQLAVNGQNGTGHEMNDEGIE